MQYGTPNGGIPIQDEIHEQFPPEVKKAWETFHAWWREQDRPVSRTTMPEDIKQALMIMKEAPIPGYEGAHGSDSCYVLGVEANMID